MTDPIEFGKEIGGLIREAISPLRHEVDELRKQVAGGGDPAGGGASTDLEALADLVVAKLLDSPRLMTLVDVATADAVSKHFEANPVQHGRDADPVSDHQLSAVVAKYMAENPAQAGADGVGLAGAMIDREGELVITTTKGEAIRLGRVVGEDGQDGLSFDTATGEYDSARGFVITLGGGDRRKEFVLPYMVHRGFWREGLGTKSGQSVTHDGALWIAKRDNASRPCLENASDWILAARKGRDGKDGRSPPGPATPIKLGGGNG